MSGVRSFVETGANEVALTPGGDTVSAGSVSDSVPAGFKSAVRVGLGVCAGGTSACEIIASIVPDTDGSTSTTRLGASLTAVGAFVSLEVEAVFVAGLDSPDSSSTLAESEELVRDALEAKGAGCGSVLAGLPVEAGDLRSRQARDITLMKSLPGAGDSASDPADGSDTTPPGAARGPAAGEREEVIIWRGDCDTWRAAGALKDWRRAWPVAVPFWTRLRGSRRFRYPS